ELAREALRQAAQRELAHRERCGLRISLDARRGAGEEQAAAAALDHAFQRGLRDEEAAVRGDCQRLAHFLAIEAEEWAANAVARVVPHQVRRIDRAEERFDLTCVRRVAGMERGAGLFPEGVQF